MASAERRRAAFLIVFGAVAPISLLIAPLLAAELAATFHVGADRVGAYFFVELGAASLATLPALAWRGRVPPRRVATLACLFFAAANGSSLLATTFGQLLLLRAGSGLCGGTLLILCMRTASASAARDRLFGLWVSAQLVAGAVALALLPPLFAATGLRGFCALLALLALLATPLAAAVPDDADPDIAGARSRVGGLRPAQAAALASILGFYIGVGGFWTFIGALMSAAGLTTQASSAWLAIATLFGIAGSGLATALGRPGRRAAATAVGLALLGLAIALAAPPASAGRLILSAVLFKFAWTFVLPFLLAGAATTDGSGRIMVLANAVIGAGLALGPFVAGLALARAGAAAMIGGCLIATAASYLLMRGTLRSPAISMEHQGG